MAPDPDKHVEETKSLISNGKHSAADAHIPRTSLDSVSSASSTSLVLENLNSLADRPVRKLEPLEYRDDDSDLEAPTWKDGVPARGSNMSKQLKRVIWVISAIAVAGWALALLTFLIGGRYKHSSTLPYDHEAPAKSSGHKINLNQVQQGYFYPQFASLTWTPGPHGEDGLLFEIGQPGKDYVVVEDVRSRKGSNADTYPSKTILQSAYYRTEQGQIYVDAFSVSPDFKKVLVVTDRERVHRHSYTGVYYIVDVETQSIEPLDHEHPASRVQLAQWAPTSDSIVFTRDNNMYLRITKSTAVRQITTDGGPEYFYGIPDWVYEEEVLQGAVGAWWARDGQYIAFMRTNETAVPEYPVQFFQSRPSKVHPPPGLDKYPDITRLKYPKAGAPNPVVDIMFYDVARNEVFSVDIPDGYADDNRIIADIIWADGAKCLVRELNRESDTFRMVLIDVAGRTGKVVRKFDVKAYDNGWIEPGQTAKYLPADPERGRPQDGYIDVVIHDDNSHLAYFSPMDSNEPVKLTSGHWAIDREAYWVDPDHNTVYFVAAKESPIQRHIYSVDLRGQKITPIVPIDKPAYYSAEFSAKAGYALINLEGPGIPLQKVISLPPNPVNYEEIVNRNDQLANIAANHELPQKVFSTVEIDGYTINVMEQRPRHFDSRKQYPVLFHQYSGPGSQQVNVKFNIDFQSYVVSSLEYIVVTVDPRGTGFIGRKAQCITRGQLGKYEAHDHIAVAKIWGQKPYIDAERMAIWGWSFGGFTTLKVLETDAGETFKYGIAVAPVTDWRFYDSIYTERYMFTPQNNYVGYERSTVNNATALSQNVRFMMMHGVADDNVHFQNTLALIDKLDLAGVTNYDVHFFPDSDHNIWFHNANRIVYEKIEKWLVNAFNGHWYEYSDPVPE